MTTSRLESPAVFCHDLSPIEYHDLKCDGCDKSPLWGAVYTCIQCTDELASDSLDLCQTCTLSAPHPSEHILVKRPPTTMENPFRLSLEASTSIARCMMMAGVDTVRGEEPGHQERITRMDVANTDFGTAPEAESALEKEDPAFHPFLSAIPHSLMSLFSNKSNDLEEDLVKVYQEFGVLIPSWEHLKKYAKTKKIPDDPTKRTEWLANYMMDILNNDSELCVTQCIVHFGVSILSVLAKASAEKDLGDTKLSELSCLPDFMKSSKEVIDFPNFDGSSLVMLSWVAKLSFSPTSGQIHSQRGKQEEPRLAIMKIPETPDLDVFVMPLHSMSSQTASERCQNYVSYHMTDDSSVGATQGIYIFVSHRWRTEAHPDPEGEDWSEIQQFLCGAVRMVVDTLALFLSVGIAHNAIDKLAHCPPELFQNVKHPMGGMVHWALSRDLVALAVQNIPSIPSDDPGSFLEDSLRSSWCNRVIDSVYVWFDYASLPQRPRTKLEDAHFHQSLDCLESIQNAMSTVIVGPDERYFERAWCVAEWQLKKENSTPRGFHREDELTGDLPLGMRHGKLRSEVFTCLLDPNHTSTEDVLEQLGLGITNGKDDSMTVCRILWEGVRSILFEIGMFYFTDSYVILKHGTLDEQCRFLSGVAEHGFTSEMFTHLPAVTGGSPSPENRTIQVFVFAHQVIKGESESKCLKRDIAILKLAAEGLMASRVFEGLDYLFDFGLTQTTAVKKFPYSLLFGLSSDSCVVDVSDFLIPMEGSHELQTLFYKALFFNRAALAVYDDSASESPPHDETNSEVSGNT